LPHLHVSFDCRGTQHGNSHETRLGEHHFDKGVSVVGLSE
jgi:hypothetical protein